MVKSDTPSLIHLLGTIQIARILDPLVQTISLLRRTLIASIDWTASFSSSCHPQNLEQNYTPHGSSQIITSHLLPTLGSSHWVQTCRGDPLRLPSSHRTSAPSCAAAPVDGEVPWSRGRWRCDAWKRCPCTRSVARSRSRLEGMVQSWMNTRKSRHWNPQGMKMVVFHGFARLLDGVTD